MSSYSHWGMFGDERFEGIVLMVRDSRGTFTFEDWQKMPPEIPPPFRYENFVTFHD